jgi:hypothetical protein
MALLTFDRNPPPRQLRQFSAIWLPATVALLGWLVYRRGGTWDGALVTWGIGAVLAVAANLRPAVARGAWVTSMTLAFPVGWVVSHVVLAAAYYLVMTPMGWAMRMAGHDPMHRGFEPRATTYWKEHDPGTSKARYLRQF